MSTPTSKTIGTNHHQGLMVVVFLGVVVVELARLLEVVELEALLLDVLTLEAKLERLWAGVEVCAVVGLDGFAKPRVGSNGIQPKPSK